MRMIPVATCVLSTHYRACKTAGPSREQPRCLGPALAAALHLLAVANQRTPPSESFGSDALPLPQACTPSRVLLITTGPATKVGHCVTLLLCTMAQDTSALCFVITVSCWSPSERPDALHKSLGSASPTTGRDQTEPQTYICASYASAVTPTTHHVSVAYLSCALPQGPGQVPLSNLDSRQGPEDPQASKGAAQFFQEMAQQAAQAGVAVDVMAVGQAAVNVPLLSALTHKTGGRFMTHQRKPPKQGTTIMTMRSAIRAAAVCHMSSIVQQIACVYVCGGNEATVVTMV